MVIIDSFSKGRSEDGCGGKKQPDMTPLDAMLSCTSQVFPGLAIGYPHHEAVLDDRGVGHYFHACTYIVAAVT